MLRRHSGKDLDDIEDDADFNIYEHLMGGKGDDPQNSSIGISLIRPPQRRASLSKERSNKIPEGYITSDSNQLKFRWLSLMAFFSAIGLLAVLASNKQISFSFSFPSMSNNLVDDKLASIGSEKKPSDIPFFWHIPRSAGTSFKLISSKCLGFVLAAEYGNDAISDTKSLKVVDLAKPKGKFVNVDVTTVSGLKKAKKLGLAQSKLADVIYSGQFQDVVDLFDSKHQGRMFTFMRDPVERSLSLYQSLASRKSFLMTLEEYAQSSIAIDNWMVRQLTGKENEKLNAKDLEVAKEIFRERVIMGLTSDPAGSFRRFRIFFGWKLSTSQEKCVNDLLLGDWAKKNNELQVSGGHKSMQALKIVNEYDIQLYSFAKELYKHQGRLIS